MNTCGTCGGEARLHSISRYEVRKELVSGMHVEVFDAVHTLVCEKCGSVLRTDIPNLPGLLAAVAVMRSTMEKKLNGQEIRFMRKAMEKTAKILAANLDVTEETISRWENNKLVVSNQSERMLRVLVCKELGDKTGIQWDDDEILYRMKINPVANQPELKLCLVSSRKEIWREKKQKAA